MTDNNHIRVAIVGLGAVTRNIHLPAYRSLADKVKIVAGCDNDSTARQTAKEKFGVPEVFEDARKMIAETAPDIVTICTPPSLHVEQSLMALEAGSHVFCEKPVAETLADAAKLVRAAAEAGRHVVVNNQFPYMNIHLVAKAMIGTPEFGKLMFLQAWQIFHPDEFTEADWRGRLRHRLCFEFGIHVFSLARFFFEDDPVAVSARMPNPLSKFESDALNLITLEFADGRAASIILNRLSNAPERYLDMRLDGENASITTSIGGEVRLEAGIHTRQRRPFVSLNFAKGGKAVLQKGTRSRIIARDGINPFASSTAHHFSNFIDAIRSGATPPGTVAVNRRTLALVFAAYDSAEKNRTVYLKDYLDVETAAAVTN
ncbi:MAG: Gfo/Idh/MocA family oxidoreductase [Acidobacteriota bacterium]